MPIQSRVSFELTEKQTYLLQDFFDQNEIDTGLVIGQFFKSTDSKGFVLVAYVNGDRGKKLLGAIGLDPDAISQPHTPGVHIDME